MKSYYKHTTLKAIAGILLISMPLWSCKKFVDTKPTTSLLGDYIFDTDATITAALNGTYAQFTSSINSVYTVPALLADELTYSFDLVSTNNTYTPDDNLYGFFDRYYATIYDANAVLAGIDNAPKLTPATTTVVKGEALFLRAFSYFQLVNYWGNVPYVTTTDANISANIGNTPVATIYQNIIADLKTSAGLLTNTYPDPNRTRINKQVVNALLAKAYLYAGDWVSAEKSATDVIASGNYSMNPDLNSVFVSTSNETLFQAWNANGIALANSFVPTNVTLASSWTYPVRPGLAAAFGAGDQRKGTWIMAGTGAASASYYANKYKVKITGTVKEYPVIFRLAEMYLIRAEARAQQNTPALIVAGASDLQVTRTRAGLITPLVITTPAQLLTAVADERRKELSFEFGNRWFDLNRTGQTVAVLSAIKPGIDAHIMLLPFLRKYTILNKNLVQNPGYN